MTRPTCGLCFTRIRDIQDNRGEAILLHHVLGTTASDVQCDDRGICDVSWTNSYSRWQERNTQRDKDTGLHKKEIN